MALINKLSKGSNYTLVKGLPFSAAKRNWTNYTRIVAASRVMNGECVRLVAHEVGCCTKSVKNWIRTINDNNPRLEG